MCFGTPTHTLGTTLTGLLKFSVALCKSITKLFKKKKKKVMVLKMYCK